ncbi:alpha/beta hydrolase [Paraconexibacter antarcticus]|uniref:Alpha/beta hydrolase n=1 Tax=Paraconexibacter antarcticus TaxID=2949664 RepID=A0ABY5DT84_9ACTN|nr:alpha/beta hydrolase [Paraconexibacter antarcticus]UTI65238.1 alpha/beta hydrolase [Paraconexibacter antarcticus]
MPVTRHAYGPERDQFAELHLPETAPGAPLPVAVVVHGGFWTTENGGVDRMTGLCEDLVARGWAAWNVEYRRLGGGSGGGWPQTAQDVSAAIDHLVTLEDAPLDLARVVSIGHSAGGHLTLLDAARASAAVRVAATVGQAPLTDVQFAHDLGGPATQVVEAFMGGAPGAVGDTYAQASPVRLVPLGVPILLVQGELDDLVPPRMVAAFADAARAAGDDVTLELRPHDGHFDHLDPLRGAWATTADWLQARLG